MERLWKQLCLLVIALILDVPTVTAQTYDAGHAKYERGDFKGAERALQIAAEKETAKLAKASILKLLGICQYMLGNRSEASKSFREAVALDSTVTIKPGEVLDDTVIDYFSRIKKETTKSAPTATTATIKHTPSTTPDKAATKAAGTFIIVQSDVPDANVMIDGILAGSTNTKIEVEPGMLMIEISSARHEAKFQKVNTIEGTTTNVTVDLAKTKKIKKVAKQREKKPKKTSRKKPKNDDLFGETQPPQRAGYNPAMEFDQDTGGTAYAPGYHQPYYQQPYQQPYAYEQPYAPPPRISMHDAYEDDYETRAPSHNNYFIALLPFGAGQFQNRSIAAGILFFAAEAGALGFYYMQDKDAKETAAELNAFIQEKADNGDELTVEDETYINDTKAYVTNTRNKSKYGLYGFGAAWIAGIVEAIINDPLANASRQSRRRSPNRYGLIDHTQILVAPEDRDYKRDWQVQLIPHTSKNVANHRLDSETFKLQWTLEL